MLQVQFLKILIPGLWILMPEAEKDGIFFNYVVVPQHAGGGIDFTLLPRSFFVTEGLKTRPYSLEYATWGIRILYHFAVRLTVQDAAVSEVFGLYRFSANGYV